MRASRLFFVVGLVGAIALVSDAAPASAQLEGPCTATGQWQDADLFVDAEAVGSEVVEIPRKDKVDWTGSIAAEPGDGCGSIWLELPPPFGKVEIDSWTTTGTNNSNFGTNDYDLPKFVPANVEFTVAGEHTDTVNGTCTGSVTIKIKGGVTDSPVFYAAAVATIAFGALLGFSLVPVFQAIIKSGIKAV
ncbi:MAG TPA: hypothetical protein PLV13_03795 [Ilumatobacteraceae bacterium]|nr:hypothetical protein [Ilumatobacteraceae bacterium]